MYRMGDEEWNALKKIIKSKQLFRVGEPAEGHFQEVIQFEKEWAEKIGTKYALLMSGGGTSAMIAALVGMNIGPGDEVIIPAYTFMATPTAVLAVGAIPVIAEIDETLTIDPSDIKKKISKYTKAIIPVHMVGMPSDMDRIMKIARKQKIKVLEDACQADGGSYKKKRLGSIGDAGAFSFNYFKIISCGEGGGLVTNSTKIIEKALIYHDCGCNFWPYLKKFSIPIFSGVQYRASEIMGAVLRVQLKRLDTILADLRSIKNIFINELSDEAGIQFIPSYDPEGDCAVVAAFQFEDEQKARKFATSEDINGWLPIDTGRHIYINWDPVLNKLAGPNPALNPFNLPQNKNLNHKYSKDMCKQSLDILNRTVFISLNPDWSEQEIEKKIIGCRSAVKSL